MLKIEDAAEIIKGYADTLGEKAMADIGVKLLEKDVPESEEIKRLNEENKKLTEELEAERKGRAEDEKSYEDRINKFVYGGDPGPGPEPDVLDPEPEKDDVAVEESFYERMYGDE